jgi:hypothetical protein
LINTEPVKHGQEEAKKEAEEAEKADSHRNISPKISSIIQFLQTR